MASSARRPYVSRYDDWDQYRNKGEVRHTGHWMDCTDRNGHLLESIQVGSGFQPNRHQVHQRFMGKYNPLEIYIFYNSETGHGQTS